MKNKLGMYVQNDGDVGDATHRTGLVCALSALLGDYDTANAAKFAIWNNCEISDGVYIRHPAGYGPNWACEPSNFSRDQASRVMLGMSVLGEKAVIKRWLWQMAKRGFLHQNNQNPVEKTWRPRDIMAPGEWRNVIRGLDLWFLYPVLLLLDMTFITDLYTRSKWDGGSLVLPDLIYATKKYPTPFSLLVRRLAKKTTILEEIKNNHSAEKNGCVELIPLFEKVNEL